jgi:hypothetical protein
MAKKKTIGILNALVTADAAQLKKEFASVDNTIRRSTMGWQKQLKGGLKLGAGIFGAQAGLGALVGEIQHVIANVERIPGINPEAVASIVTARTEFSRFRNTIDSSIASVLALGTTLAKSVGAGAAMLGGASGDDVVAGLSKLETPDDVAAGKDDQYYDKVAAARTRLAEAQKKAAQAGLTDAEQIKALREEAARYEAFAQSSSINSLQRLEANIEAQERSAAADQKLAGMKKQLKDAETALSASVFGAARAKLTDKQAVELLDAKVMRLNSELAELYRLLRDHPNDPAFLQAQIEKTKELTEANKQLEKLGERLGKKFEAAGQDIAQSFEGAIFEGGSLREMLRGLEQDILRIAFRTAITEPLGKALGGMFSGVGSWIGGMISGKASGGPVSANRPYIVGEEGPELMVPGTGGTIVPNHALQGGSGSVKQFFVDMRGASIEAVERLHQLVRQVDGSIEQRALGAMTNYRHRRAAAS